MIKLTYVLRRRPTMSREEFHRYWNEEHARLVASKAEVLHIRRYVQVDTLETPLDGPLSEGRGHDEPYDGVAELWFDSIEDVAGALGTEEGQAAAADLLEDEGRFIDLPRSPIWMGEEHVVVG